MAKDSGKRRGCCKKKSATDSATELAHNFKKVEQARKARQATLKKNYKIMREEIYLTKLKPFFTDPMANHIAFARKHFKEDVRLLKMNDLDDSDG